MSRSDPDIEPTITWQKQGLEKIGTYYDELSGQMVLDASDHAVPASLIAMKYH